jgi:hypothetical protein
VSPAPDQPRSRWWLLAAVAAWWATGFLVPGFWRILGIGEFGGPFIDLHGSLAASDAAAQGLNPYAPNRLDPFGRPHLYSSWWFLPGKLGLNRGHLLWVGTGILAAVLATVAARLRLRSWDQWLGALAFLGSPALLLAANRANNDLVVFLLVAVALALFGRGTPGWRLAAWAVVGLATVLKYYPAALLVLLASAANRRQVAREAGVFALVVALGWSSLGPGLAAAQKYWASLHGLYAFGAPELLLELGLDGVSGWGRGLLAAWALVAFARAWRRRTASPAPDDPATLAGCALLAATFVLGGSYTYKLVFGLLLLPAVLTRAGPARPLGTALFAVAWADGLTALLLNLSGVSRLNPLHAAMEHTGLVVSSVAQWALALLAIQWLARHAVERLAPRAKAGA